MTTSKSIPVPFQYPAENTTIEIPLTRGYAALVDAVDAELIQYKWSVHLNSANTVYVKGNLKTDGKWRRVSLHRVIMERVIGHGLEKDQEVDHIDGNGLNNCRSNLRIATHAQNQHNSCRPKNNSSGYKGVSYFKRSSQWRADITVNRKKIFLGYFATAKEAYAVYCEAAMKYHGEFARLE